MKLNSCRYVPTWLPISWWLRNGLSVIWPINTGMTLRLLRKLQPERPVQDCISICVLWKTVKTRCWKTVYFLKLPVRLLREWWSLHLPLQLSVIRILLLISVWCRIRKLRQIFVGVTVTVPYWYVFRLDGRQKQICVCWLIRWKLPATMIQHRNKLWKCVLRTVLPICTNW